MKIKDILDFLTSNNETYEFVGNQEKEILGFSSLKNYNAGTFTWVKKLESIPKGFDLNECDLIITGKNKSVSSKNVIYADNSKRVFFELMDFFSDRQDKKEIQDKIGNNNYISENVSLGKNVEIGNNCTIDGDIIIGDYCVIGSNVSILGKVEIGRKTIIQSGVCIGDSDLAYVDDTAGNRKILKHHGGVKIGEAVYIGTNSVISRGTIDDTVVGDETSIDALCQISHNCILGKKNTVVAGSLVYGSVVTGDDVYIASSIIMNQMKLGDRVTVGMNSVVMSDIIPDVTVVGTPAKPLNKENIVVGNTKK